MKLNLDEDEARAAMCESVTLPGDKWRSYLTRLRKLTASLEKIKALTDMPAYDPTVYGLVNELAEKALELK